MRQADLDGRLRALSHSTRRRLIAACLAEPRSAGWLVDLVGLSPASVSEHLKILRKTGLLELERRGTYRLYRSDPAVVDDVARALADLGAAESGR